MSPQLLFSFVFGYFFLLLGVAWYTSRNSNNETFFIGTVVATGYWWHLV
jgi:hypothetical protein